MSGRDERSVTSIKGSFTRTARVCSPFKAVSAGASTLGKLHVNPSRPIAPRRKQEFSSLVYHTSYILFADGSIIPAAIHDAAARFWVDNLR